MAPEHSILFKPVVLKLEFSLQSPGGLFKPQVARPTPRVSDSGK